MGKRKWSEEEINEYRRKHNNYLFYYNKDDANLYVPRADVFMSLSITGMTLNWAHPLAKAFAAIILIAAIIFPVFFNIKYGR